MVKQTRNNNKRDQVHQFSTLLLQWNKQKNKRQMPWKGEKDPYKIWLSEIILQQTRVEQGLGYYYRFIETFPDIGKLAEAPDSKILSFGRAWVTTPGAEI